MPTPAVLSRTQTPSLRRAVRRVDGSSACSSTVIVCPPRSTSSRTVSVWAAPTTVRRAPSRFPPFSPSAVRITSPARSSPALRRVGNHQHAARLERHADGLSRRESASALPRRSRAFRARESGRAAKRSRCVLPAGLRAERYALILRGRQHADRPARPTRRASAARSAPQAAARKTASAHPAATAAFAHPWGIIAYRNAIALSAMPKPCRTVLFHAQSLRFAA